MRRAWSRRKFARHLPGFVEQLGPNEISGWVGWVGDAPPEIRVVLGGQENVVVPAWRERPDVVSAFPNVRLLCGFSFALSPKLMKSSAFREAGWQALIVLVNGEPLPVARTHGIKKSSLQEDALVGLGSPASLLYLTRDLSLMLDGLVVFLSIAITPTAGVLVTVKGAGVGSGRLRLFCGDEESSLLSSSEASENLLVGHFELPGYWWLLPESHSGVPLRVLLNGKNLLSSPAILSVEHGFSLLRGISRKFRGNIYAELIALEHAHFLQEIRPLPAGLLYWLQSVAAEYGLREYIQSTNLDSQAADPLDTTLYSALGQLNQGLLVSHGNEIALLEKVSAQVSADKHKKILREALFAWFCREGRHEEAARVISRCHLAHLQRSGSAWKMSLALPLLIDDLAVVRDLLKALPSRKGWVATECLLVFSELLLGRYSRSSEIESIGLSLLALAERWASDYWSRKEDERLVDACLVWLRQLARFSPDFQMQFASGCMRVWGMSPFFWRRIGGYCEGDFSHIPLLREGWIRFLAISGSMKSNPILTNSSSLMEAVEFFRVNGCYDADRWLRELMVATSVSSVGMREDTSDSCKERILRLGNFELVRFAALPAASSVLEWPVDVLAEQTISLQRGVIRSSQTRSLRGVSDALIQYGLHGVPLTDKESDALSTLGDSAIDLLASAWSAAPRRDVAQQLAGYLAARLNQALPSLRMSPPSQPVLAGIARLLNDPRLGEFPELSVAIARISDRLPWLGKTLILSMKAFPPVKNSASNDVVVVIYSCQKYLGSRVEAIRDTWMKDVQARGLRCLIVVGDGNDSCDGDVLRLAVSDSYEQLPAKTLALFRWLYLNTSYQYVVKVDDDCLLNVSAFFDDLSYRQYHYYGRVLRRTKGGIDRRWHQEKASSLAARSRLDKSPEPSSYADGGSGYSLSRYAISRLLEVAETPAGVRLIAVSFMEDKVVGDLLALGGIFGCGDDYHTQVRRRLGSDVVPVSVFENTFFPSQAYPAKLAHLDTAADMRMAWEHLASSGLLPKKLWPSFSPPSFEHGTSNQLELLSSLDRVISLSTQQLFVVSVVRNEIMLLPQFLKHYRAQGVGAFVFVDNLSSDGTRAYLLDQPDVILYSADSEYRHAHFGVTWQQTVLYAHCLGRWALVADADEFIVCPKEMRLCEYVFSLAAADYDASRVMMIDMYPKGIIGAAAMENTEPFNVAPFFDRIPYRRWLLGSGQFSNSKNYTNSMRHRLLPHSEPNAYVAQKYSLVRYLPWMRFADGMHGLANANIAPECAWFAHFKYHSAFSEKVREEIARGQHFDDASDYRKYESMSGGDAVFFDLSLSARYESSESFKNIPSDV